MKKYKRIMESKNFKIELENDKEEWINIILQAKNKEDLINYIYSEKGQRELKKLFSTPSKEIELKKIGRSIWFKTKNILSAK